MEVKFLACVLNVIRRFVMLIISYANVVYFKCVWLLQLAMDGNYGCCYAVGCTSRHREGIYSAKLCTEKVDRLCTMEEAGFLHYKFLCQDHFLPTGLTTPEGIRLNRLTAPCGLDSASHSIWQSSPPLLLTLQLHVWLEIKWYNFQLASVLFRFELQQVVSAIVCM